MRDFNIKSPFVVIGLDYYEQLKQNSRDLFSLRNEELALSEYPNSFFKTISHERTIITKDDVLKGLIKNHNEFIKDLEKHSRWTYGKTRTSIEEYSFVKRLMFLFTGKLS